MNYAQLRRALSVVADAGDTAPTRVLSPSYWQALRNAGCVRLTEWGRWALTERGRYIHEHDHTKQARSA